MLNSHSVYVQLLLPSLLLLSSFTNAGFPYNCLRPFVATFPIIAVILCSCCIPIPYSCLCHFVATFPTIACYLPYCCCRPLQMLASHTAVSVPLLLPSLLLLSSSANAGFPYFCLRPLLLTSPLLLSSSANAGFPKITVVCVPNCCWLRLVQIFFKVYKFTNLSYSTVVQNHCLRIRILLLI
jgi:hypothetical protein